MTHEARDLSEALARANATQASLDTAREIVEVLSATLDGSEVRWELEAGEGWAHVSLRDADVAHVKIPTTSTPAGPLVVLRRDVSTVRDRISRFGVPIVVVADFSAPIFRAQTRILQAFTGRQHLYGDLLDPNGFAIDDLIFASE